MSLFSVGDVEFASRVSFNQYLTESYSVADDGDLYVIAGLTDYSWPEFRTLLENRGYEILEEYGEIVKMACDYGTDGRIEFYLSFDRDTQIILFYTNMRKSEEIENTIEILLRETPRVHYLYIAPRVMQDIRETIAADDPNARVTQFSSHRVERSDIEARIRPDFSRTIQYFGDDGLQTMREMEENYGVVPRLMEFRIPDTSNFKINREGVFNLQGGDLGYLFEHVETCIENALRVRRAYENASFEMVRTTGQLEVPTAEPASISLQNRLQYHEVEDFKASMKENDYVLLDTFAEEGSLFFSSKVIDQEKKNSFRIKANEDEIRVFPQENKDLGSFFRFYEFIQNSIDEDASLNLEAQA
ncbi:hypothetical protein [Halorussus amylolyticus]|uniref:hypothetical protein n=1 Tax=Halorussus amylolyticus TaxID=1126242 RepID=UPI00104A0AAB|nr:hypothetical protein [Halorussus amylolyticus]